MPQNQRFFKTFRLIAVSGAALLASYPLSAYAAEVVSNYELMPPFVFSWLGVWFFSLGGGICASFIRVPESDVNFNKVVIAKILIGTLSGVAICSMLDWWLETNSSGLVFFAFFASLFSAPIAGGAVIWMSNQDRLNGAFNRVARSQAQKHFPIAEDFMPDRTYKKEGDDNADHR